MKTSMEELLQARDDQRIIVDSHLGLTFKQIFDDPDHYFTPMTKAGIIDLLCVGLDLTILLVPSSTRKLWRRAL